MKNFLTIFFLSVFLFSCTTEDRLDNATVSQEANPAQIVNAQRLATGSNVKLLSAWTSFSQRYNYATYKRRFKVEVRNLAFNKTVIISHKMADGSWKDFPLQYSFSTNTSTEIWAGELVITNNGYVPVLLFGNEFVVRYEVNGQKYWDNNNQNNYIMNNLEGTYLRADLNVISDTYSSAIYSNMTTNIFEVHADIRNLSPTKQVTVRYTTNGWITYQSASLSYTQWLSVGAQQQLYSPNGFGIERWVANINIPSTVNSIQYAIVYKVNGVEYWDNNFDKNYKVTK